MTERALPQDPEAEQATLGGMLLSRWAIAEVAEIIDPGDFYQPKHETIYAAILALYADGRPADALTVAAELDRRGQLAKVGGAPYLHHLAGSIPTAANAGYYAQTVRDHAKRRSIIRAGTRIVAMGYETDDASDLPAIIDRAQAETHALSDRGLRADEASNAETFDEMLERIERGIDAGLPTGFADLDALTHGLQPGQLVIIAGRPALGKSTLGVDIVRSVSIRHRLQSAMFSLEMGRGELMRRITSAEARVPLHHLASGAMTDEDWRRVAAVRERVVTAPVVIDDAPELSMMRIRTEARRLRQKRDLRLAVVDYMQLMGTGSSRRPESRQQEVSEMSRGLKLLAKELEIPIVAIAQLNRGPEQRTDKRPMMSDLRESGSLEQDADVVILLHREDAYERESPRAGEADLIVAKHRNGPTAVITVAFQGHFSRFVDMARSDDWSPHRMLDGA